MGKSADPNRNIDVSDMELILQGLNHLDQGIALYDTGLVLRLFNDQFESVLGYPKGFVQTGMPFEELIRYSIKHGEFGPGDPDQLLEERLEQVREMKPHKVLRERPNGTIIKISASPLPYGGFVATYEDITETENAKREIEAREEEFRTYMELSPVGALLVKLDGQISFYNSRFLEIFGYTAEEMEKAHTSGLYYNPDDRKTFIKTLTSSKSPSNFHFYGKQKDGSAIPVLLTSTLISLKGEERIFSWVNDLSGMQEAEKTIERLNEQNEMILTAAGAGIFGLDENNIIQFMNPAAAALLEYGENDLQGKHLKKLLADDTLLEITHSRQSVSGEAEMIRRSGRKFPVKYTLSSLDSGDDINGKVIVFDDISERIAAEVALRQAMEDIEASSLAKSAFLSTMSHELRTPLNAILGFTQILNANQTQNLNEQQLLFIDHIFGAGEHLLKLVNEAIDIASIESGQVSLSRQSVELKEVCDLCITQLSEMATRRKINIQGLDESQKQLCVIADYARLQQVITHLLSNAIKYNKEDGEVSFKASEEDNHMIRLSITDTGRGISKDEKEDIFAPFSRLNAHSLGIEGTGLGLTLTRHLTQLMGGRISYESNLDQGSTFWVELPKAQKGAPLLYKEDRKLNP